MVLRNSAWHIRGAVAQASVLARATSLLVGIMEASVWAQRAALLRGDGDDNDRAQVLSDADVDALTQLYADQLRIDMHLLRNTGKGADGKDADVEGADSSDADVEDADSADSDGHAPHTKHAHCRIFFRCAGKHFCSRLTRERERVFSSITQPSAAI